MSKTKYKVIDLFAGCGGISRGFEWTKRFGIEFAAELLPHPAQTLAANVSNAEGKPTRVYQGDIHDLADRPKLLWRQLKDVGIMRAGDLDVLAGGPPCQGFSRNGVRMYVDTARRRRFYDDPRNHLYKAFLRIVEVVQPKIVLVENVREFLNFGDGKFSEDLVARFEELGYVIDFKKICAADVGVPQVRHRVFFVAVRSDVAAAAGSGPVFPISEFSAADTQTRLFESPYRTVRDAIADLPAPTKSKADPPAPYPRSARMSEYAALLRNPSGVVHNHFSRSLSPKQTERIRAVGTGRMKHIRKSLQTKAFYGSAYGRLIWDQPALTITTWVYHVGSGRFAHPIEDRGITMREAARLQSFDDAFVFPALVNPVSQMIGNAVPPLVANKFAELFVEILDAYSGTRKPNPRTATDRSNRRRVSVTAVD